MTVPWNIALGSSALPGAAETNCTLESCLGPPSIDHWTPHAWGPIKPTVHFGSSDPAYEPASAPPVKTTFTVSAAGAACVSPATGVPVGAPLPPVVEAADSDAATVGVAVGVGPAGVADSSTCVAAPPALGSAGVPVAVAAPQAAASNAVEASKTRWRDRSK